MLSRVSGSDGQRAIAEPRVAPNTENNMLGHRWENDGIQESAGLTDRVQSQN